LGYSNLFDFIAANKKGGYFSGSAPGDEGDCRRMTLIKDIKLLAKSTEPYSADQLKTELVDECFQNPLKMLAKTLQKIVEVIPFADPKMFNGNFHNFTYARIHSKPGGIRQQLHSDFTPYSEGNYI
jgi:hypothetical protein